MGGRIHRPTPGRQSGLLKQFKHGGEVPAALLGVGVLEHGIQALGECAHGDGGFGGFCVRNQARRALKP